MVPPGNEDRLQRRFAALTESIPQIVWLAGDDGHWTWSSPRWTACTGLSASASRGRGWIAAIAPDDRGLVDAAWQAAPSRGRIDVNHGLIFIPNGEIRLFHTHSTPLPTVAGQPREWLGTCTDATETRQIEQSEDWMLAELRHRTADVLALVRLALRQVPNAGKSVEDFALHLEGRLNAVARTQATLARRPGAGLDLEQLIAEEGLVRAAHEGGQIHTHGPAILLLGRAASMFGLVVHELMENSVQYGALSTPAGCITMTWRVDAGDLLRFEWLETGYVLPDEPRHRGFGTDLIERILSQELGGTASLDFGQGGVRCVIVLPLTPGGITALKG